jgi:hypothetical protein
MDDSCFRIEKSTPVNWVKQPSNMNLHFEYVAWLLLLLSVQDIVINSVVSGLPLSRIRGLNEEASTKEQKRSKSESSQSKDSLKQTKSDVSSKKPPPTKDSGDISIGKYEGCDQISTCATSFQELQDAILDANSGDLIGICANISVDSDPIRVDNTDITLVGCCCDSKCIINGSGKSQNLVATGQDFTLLNVIVQGGRCGLPIVEGGGNLQYVSSVGGSLLVVDCEFLNGVCERLGGGNVDIATAGSVTFRRTVFKNGNAATPYLGGGAYVTESVDITVDDCLFDGNKGTGFGLQYGGDGSRFFKAVIKDSVFTNNIGGPAGGIFYTDFGALQRLEVLRTEFTSNTATDVDGAGAAFISQNIAPGPTTFFWDGNFGSGNTGGRCADTLYWDDCFTVDTTFTPP